MSGFNYGTPAGRGPQLRLDPRLAMAFAALLAVALVGVGFLRFVSKSGHEVANDQVTVIQQVDRAKDAAAQSTLRNALAAEAVAFSDSLSFADAGPAQLSLIEPSLTWVDGPSSASTVVSVASDDSAWGAAVLSDSGTCFWVRLDEENVTTYGTGTPCTGQAALAGATAPTW